MTSQEYMKRQMEVTEAMRKYPEMEIGAAYARWKTERGETATKLSTGDMDVTRAQEHIKIQLSQPCPKCEGKMELEGICTSCVEGRKGYKSKWTCPECMHRELSKRGVGEWMSELLSKVSSSQMSPSTQPEAGRSLTSPGDGSETVADFSKPFLVAMNVPVSGPVPES